MHLIKYMLNEKRGNTYLFRFSKKPYHMLVDSVRDSHIYTILQVINIYGKLTVIKHSPSLASEADSFNLQDVSRNYNK